MAAKMRDAFAQTHKVPDLTLLEQAASAGVGGKAEVDVKGSVETLETRPIVAGP
jgi:hypothetical protein